MKIGTGGGQGVQGGGGGRGGEGLGSSLIGIDHNYLRAHVYQQIDLPKGSVISLLGSGKPTSVDAVVDGRIHPAVHFLNNRPEILWVQIQVRSLGNIIELTASNR